MKYHLNPFVLVLVFNAFSNAMRRLGQRVAQSERQREDMYIFGEEAADLDSQLGACARNEVKILPDTCNVKNMVINLNLSTRLNAFLFRNSPLNTICTKHLPCILTEASNFRFDYEYIQQEG